MLIIHKAIAKYQNLKYWKYLACLGAIILLYLSYQFYAWCNTQASDNAYIDADISNVSAEISGKINKILILENSQVACGDLIATIDDGEYKANLAKAVADVEASTKDVSIIKQKIIIEQINLEKNKEIAKYTKTNLDIIEVDYRRTIGLNKDNFTSKKLLDIARIAFEKAKSEYIQTAFNLQTSEQNLILLNTQQAVAEAKLESLIQERNIAELHLNNTKIITPIDGIVSNSGLRVGSFVQPGVPLFSVVPNNKLYIRVNFKETQLAKLKVGMQAMIIFDALPNKRFVGKIRSISPATGAKFSLFPPDNATGNFTKIVQRVPVLIDFTESEVKQFNLVPGMSAIVTIRTDQ
ncbi:HlyD family secretion protein [Candidatus Trichorickettsia mobilis]|uniref:HlyD family secretion protein n=1 Tax=Candidatus Trichorickettsia mobilis TaxID=1346319 RepID=A0ABZ0USV4_9RICK|nr:HlyD family secretion protein [Candidatus Trichorickettsia mobilis]WPY00691.1 HlyD family secretion protein [Candidatus Trichorickettsia mobilis]